MAVPRISSTNHDFNDAAVEWVDKVNRMINCMSIADEFQIQQYYDQNCCEWYTRDKHNTVIKILCKLKVNHIGCISLWKSVYGEEFLMSIIDDLYIKDVRRFTDELRQQGMKKLARAILKHSCKTIQHPVDW